MSQLITAPVKELFASDTLLLEFTGTWSSQYNKSLDRNVYTTPAVGDGQSASSNLTFSCESSCNVRIKYKVSSESNYDKFYFSLDGSAKVNGISGAGDWINAIFEVAAGEHTLQFKYSKDGSGSKNEDKAYIAELEIFPIPYLTGSNADTIRQVASLAASSVDFDLKRSLDAGIFMVEKNFDLKRFFDNNLPQIDLLIDTKRACSNLPYGITASQDTKRSIARLIQVSLNYDLYRDLLVNAEVRGDTKRTKTKGIFHDAANYDITRITAKDIKTIDIKEISINLNEKQFAYTFEVQSYAPIALGQNYAVNILDLSLNANIEKVQIHNSLYSVQASNAENEAVTNVHAFADKTGTNWGEGAIPTLKAAAQTIGKNLVILMDEYYTPCLKSTEYTYLELLSEIIGWTDGLPQRQINAYCLGDTVYIIQRGKEQFTAEIPETKYEEPTIILTRKKILGQGETTLLGEGGIGGSETSTVNDNEKNYLSGTWSYGGSSVTYSGGLVIREVHGTEKGTETTNYSYNNSHAPAKLIYKRTSNSEEIKETSYSYSEDYLVTEVETSRDIKNGSESVKTTHHYPIGSGFWATVVEENGQSASSIGQGASYEEASAYSVNQYSRKPFSSITSSLDGGIPSIDIPYRLLDLDETFPVGTQSALKQIKDDIYWLDGKIEEEVNLTCYIDKAITHNHRILWRGNWYYLKANQIIRDSHRLSQNITMVRWY